MIRNIRRRYFEVWGNEEAQNAFLKGILMVVFALFITQTIVLSIVECRKPTLIAMGQTETRVLTLDPPSEALLGIELRRLVKQYVETHYNWDASTIEKAHLDASRFVSEKFVKAFLASNAEQVKLAHAKQITQKVYLSAEIQVDSKSLTARVPMDRIFSVEGLRASAPLTLDIGFEYGPRTVQNPEGVYVTSEKVVPMNSGG